MLHRICEVKPTPNFRLRLAYADGEVVEIDFTPIIEQGGVFAPPSDPAFLNRYL